MRPIAVGDTLRLPLAELPLATSQGRNTTAALAPLQTVFAKRSTCEVVAMGLQVSADTLHWSTGWLLLLLYLTTS